MLWSCKFCMKYLWALSDLRSDQRRKSCAYAELFEQVPWTLSTVEAHQCCICNLVLKIHPWIRDLVGSNRHGAYFASLIVAVWSVGICSTFDCWKWDQKGRCWRKSSKSQKMTSNRWLDREGMEVSCLMACLHSARRYSVRVDSCATCKKRWKLHCYYRWQGRAKCLHSMHA